MDRETFWRIISEQGSYDSRSFKALRKKNSFLIPVIYYFKMAKLVVKSGVAATGKYGRLDFADSSFETVKIIESVGGRVSVSGLGENFFGRPPGVYVANHMSLLDTFILPSLILSSGRMTYVLKESLLRYPFLGSLLKSIEPIRVTRDNPRRDFKTVMKEGKTALLQGKSVIIFLQSRRSNVFDTSTLNSMGVRLASRVGVKVTPVAIKSDFQKPGRVISELSVIDTKSAVRIKFGEAMSMDSGEKTVQREAVQFIKNTLSEWGCEVN